MKYGVISDIHANVEALDAVLVVLERARVERIACLGDVVGYHASPNECIARLRSVGAIAIAGNHDRAVLQREAGSFPAPARRAIDWTRRVLTPESLDWLAGLPSVVALDATTRLVHGGLVPEPNDRYHVKSEALVGANLARVDVGTVCWFGHTHLAVCHERDLDGHVTSRVSGAYLSPDRAYFCNPGSVGQPRDGDWRAAFAICDTDERRIDLLRVSYDRAAFRKRVVAAGLDRRPLWRTWWDRCFA